MINVDAPWLVAAGLAAGLVVAVGSCAVMAWRTRRVLRRLETIERQFVVLTGEVGGAAGLAARVGERLRRLDQVAGQMGERLGQLELRGEGRPFDQAITLVRHGADADRLVAHFGLSRGEADLVSLLHGRRKAG